MPPSIYFFSAVGLTFKLRTITRDEIKQFCEKYDDWTLEYNFDTKEPFLYYKPSKEEYFGDRLSMFLNIDPYIETQDDYNPNYFTGIRVEDDDNIKFDNYPELKEIEKGILSFGKLYSASLF